MGLLSYACRWSTVTLRSMARTRAEHYSKRMSCRPRAKRLLVSCSTAQNISRAHICITTAACV